MSDDNKEYDATPQRKERFRKEGKFARSRDAAAVASTFAVIALIAGSREHFLPIFAQLFSRSLGDLEAAQSGRSNAVFQFAFGIAITLAGPPALAALLGGLVVGAAQAGLRFDTDMLGFKADRLDPIPRFMQLFSPKQSAREVALALFRTALVGYVAYRALLPSSGAILSLARVPTLEAASIVGSTALRLAIWVGGALGLVALVDYGINRFQISQEMKMSKKEMMEEVRSEEGDLKSKAKMKAKGRALAKKRALNNVKTADVLVTNPTHVAIALRYAKKDVAPVVVAKGHDDFALQLRAVARRHGIPIVEQRVLARALDAEVPLGRAIPSVHFAAVARVLAFVYKLRRRARPPARPAGTPSAPRPS